jgi:diguanylate cyclase (GGDEF)-like protein
MDTVGARSQRRRGARSTNTHVQRMARIGWPSPGRWLGAAATLTVAACATVYLMWPDGVGGAAFVAVSALGLAGLVVGPLARRATPRAGWRWIAAAGGLFLTSLTLRIGVVPSGGSPLTSADLWSILGYLAIIRGLYLLVVHSTRGSARSATLDATIVTAGAALGFFSLELGPHLQRGESLAIVLLNISYPALDAAVLALTVHLAFRSSKYSPSMVMLLSSMTTLLLADLGYLAYWHVAPFATTPWLNVIFMLSYALIGAAGVHPSVTSLAHPTPEARQQSSGNSTVLLLTLLGPAAAAVLSPVSGTTDSLVRVALLCVVLLSIHLRLRYTINALHHAAQELEQAQQRALHQALHDGLTGLANRAAFRGALIERLGAATPDRGTALLCLDSDHFKRINDTWGHPAGDAVIQELAQRLTAELRPSDQLYRLGGDEFVVLMADAGLTEAQQAAEAMLAAAAEPLPLDNGQKITMTASVGVAVAVSGQDVDPDTLVQDADIALYAAKDRGRATYALFDDSLRDSLQRRVTLAEELREAVTAGDIVPFYQPIRTGAGFGDLCGFEVLARWIRPAGDDVGPAEFIPIAEDTGLIVDIGRHMLESACTQLVTWRRSTGRDLHVSVNVSAAEISRHDVPALVADVLAATGLPAHALWLEITESVLVDDRGLAMDTLQRLCALGTVLCIDDFGTGYSSLSYLKHFPIDVVKVDREFVKDLATDATSRGLTQAIIEMVQALRLRGVVAEGVDQQAQADLLEHWGCQWAQGFLWSRPLPPTEIETMLRSAPCGHQASA